MPVRSVNLAEKPSGSRKMTDLQFCKVEREGPLTVVTLNRPEVMNALHSEAHHELEKIWDEFAARDDLWVGIVTGAGERAFSAGNDLKVQAAGKRGPRAPTGFAGLTQSLRPRQAADRRGQRHRDGRRVRDRAGLRHHRGGGERGVRACPSRASA
jgi:enoyl-CoA hydratase/carnithine racemase